MQAEGTDPELLLATGDAKQGLVLILRAVSELHAGHRQIELGEEACAARLIDQLVDVRQRFDRLLRDGVEPTVILAEAPRPVRLPREHYRGSMRGTGGDDPALVE